MKILVEFFGPEKKLMYTCAFTDHDHAEGLIRMVLIDDQFCAKGPFFMRYTDSKGKEIHTYAFCNIPPRTRAAFAYYNAEVRKSEGEFIHPKGEHLEQLDKHLDEQTIMGLNKQ